MLVDSSGRHTGLRPDTSPLSIAVLLGGPSAERDVSLASGAGVCEALRARGHFVTPVDPRDGVLDGPRLCSMDCVFIALHGAYGEDGQVQAQLEQLGVPYTGSGPAASALAMNKVRSKQAFLDHGVPTPAYAVFRADESRASIRAKADRLGWPLVVKPVENGSSLGVSIVRDPADFERAVEACLQYEAHGLIEQFIDGRELTVGILNDTALPIIELRTDREFYDYTAKYLGDHTRYDFDIDLPLERYVELQRLAEAAHHTLGAQCVSRVDLMLDAALRPYVLEINTIPGMTDHSLLPKAAARAGLTFAELCNAMAVYALAAERVAA